MSDKYAGVVGGGKVNEQVFDVFFGAGKKLAYVFFRRAHLSAFYADAGFDA